MRPLKCLIPMNPMAREDLARATFHLEVLVSTRCRCLITTMNPCRSVVLGSFAAADA